jgi:hypothetical protein
MAPYGTSRERDLPGVTRLGSALLNAGVRRTTGEIRMKRTFAAVTILAMAASSGSGYAEDLTTGCSGP